MNAIRKIAGIAAIVLGTTGCNSETQYLTAKTPDGFDVTIERSIDDETGAVIGTIQDMRIGARREGYHTIDGAKSYIQVRDNFESRGSPHTDSPVTITVRAYGQPTDAALLKYATPHAVDSIYRSMTEKK